MNEPAELQDISLPRYIRITDFDDNGKLRDDTFRSLPEEIARQAMLQEGDVLFARSGATVGKTFIVGDDIGRACFAGYLILARTNRSKLAPEFLYQFTKSFAYDAWKNLIFTQATIQNISATKYDYLAIPIPPIKEQYSILDFLHIKSEHYRAVLENLNNQITTLTAYRKSLIHECVTGKRRVTEADLERVAAAIR